MGYGSFALFELNKVHQKADGLTNENVPVERDSVALVITDAKKDSAAYYDAKRVLEYVLNTLGIVPHYQSLGLQTDRLYAPFEPKRSALVIDSKTNQTLGVVGEYKKAVQKAFKLPVYTAGFEIDPSEVLESSKKVGIRYQPLSRYPGTERDVCFQVAEAVPYAKVADAAQSTLDKTGLIATLEPLDIYKPEAGDTKNITLRFKFASYDKTMTNDEAATVINSVIESVIQATDGKVL